MTIEEYQSLCIQLMEQRDLLDRARAEDISPSQIYYERLGYHAALEDMYNAMFDGGQE